MSGDDSGLLELKGNNSYSYKSILKEENLRVIIENIQVGIVLIDAETHLIMDLNAKAEEMIGCDRSYILGKECHEFIGPAKQGQYPIIDQGQKVDNAERILINWAGKSVPILKTVKKVVIDGHPYVLDSFVDLTEQMATLEALKESEQKYRLLSENSSDVIWTMNFDGKLTYVSPSIEKLRGFTPEESIKQSLDEILMPESKKIFEAEIAKVLQSLSSGDKESIHRILEIKQPCKDGTTVLTEVSAKVIFDSNGEPIGIQGVSRDITERKKAELRQNIAYKIAVATNKSTNLGALLKYIRQEIGEIMDTKNFYIAFYDAHSDFLTFPYFVDETESEDFSAPGRKFGNGLTEYVIKRDSGLLVHDDEIMQLIENGEIELIGELPLIWLGVPLRSKDSIIGVVAVQSYTSHTAYTHNDLKFLNFISSQIASAIERKQAEESLTKKNKELERFNKLAVGRELKMVELKKEKNALLEKLGEEPRYKIVDEPYEGGGINK